MQKQFLPKRQFNKKVLALYKNEPEAARAGLIEFYNKYTTDKDTFYKRYRDLKYDYEVSGQVYLGAVLSTVMSLYSLLVQNMDSMEQAPILKANPWLMVLPLIVTLGFIAVIVCSYLKSFMSKSVLLVKPTEIAILEKLLDIKPEL
ncbi:MAG: hypothetical protein ACLSGI_06925 [Butyricicoccaceae bacterium]|nr:hypothetical protein [Clostridiaceae bacterium]